MLSFTEFKKKSYSDTIKYLERYLHEDSIQITNELHHKINIKRQEAVKELRTSNGASEAAMNTIDFCDNMTELANKFILTLSYMFYIKYEPST